LPTLALKCIASWKKFLPKHEIILWNEDNFNVEQIAYTQQAYRCKRYAFVSDYVRFWAVFNYGGIYFDTDVEVIKSIDQILAKGPFMGCENFNGTLVAPGLGFACSPGHVILKAILEYYALAKYLSEDGSEDMKTVVNITTDVLAKFGYKANAQITNVEGINIYPKEYFCPDRIFGFSYRITNKTHTIHHFQGSWMPVRKRAILYLSRFLGESPVLCLSRLHKFLLGLFKN